MLSVSLFFFAHDCICFSLWATVLRTVQACSQETHLRICESSASVKSAANAGVVAVGARLTLGGGGLASGSVSVGEGVFDAVRRPALGAA